MSITFPIKQTLFTRLTNCLNGNRRLWRKIKVQLKRRVIVMTQQNPTNQNKRTKMSLAEAGRKGGQATAKKHDKDFYEKIGRKGGEATAKKYDSNFYEEIGRKGGNATAKNHDKDFYEKIGRKGGEARVQQQNK